MAAPQVGVLPSKRSISKRLSSANIDITNVQADVRHDEEQQIKFQEILELFLAAGYFRVRIKGLSDFDKIVGGMTWCIEVCNVDIDIDLLFQENLNIGQKIYLTEKLVSALKMIKCPHRIEPHQIQGLDCIHIYPVIQWLVKKALEVKAEVGDFQRSFAIFQFSKAHGLLPEEESKKDSQDKVVSTLESLREEYCPRRKFRHSLSHKLLDEETRVQATLLEYGRYGQLLKKSKVNKDAGHGDQPRRESIDESQFSEEISHLMSGMAAMDDQEAKLSVSAVGNIVSLQSEEIQQIASHFEDKRSELLIDDKKGGGALYQQRILTSLQKQMAEHAQHLESKKQSLEELQQAYKTTNENLAELKRIHEKILAETEKLEQLEQTADKGLLEKLRELVALNEKLKAQEQEFKAHCKQERSRLLSELEELRGSSNQTANSEDQDLIDQIEAQYAAVREKLQNVRVLLARKNREIAALQRRIDEVPLRAELSQYQRRFVELCAQVSAKHKETKQFFTLYNTLNDSKMYLSKEVNLLNSIYESFTEGMATQAGRKQFLTQFEQIVEQIRLAKIKVEKKKEEEKSRRDKLMSNHIALIDQQRLYVKMVKEFKEECRKNEILMAKLKEKGH